MGKAKEALPGLSSAGRSKSYHRRGLWAIKKKNGGKLPVHPKKAAKAAVEAKAPRLYPAEDAPKPLPRRSVAAPTKQRASVAPGRVVILLAGRFKGKRAVVVKHLEPSGLLLVTGPFAVNGVPLRRVNAAYVIGTSTTVDVSGVDASKLDDATFKAAEEKAKKRTSRRGEGEAFFEEADAAAKAAKKGVSPEFVAAQKAVDGAIKLDDDLKGYLGATFSLSAGDRPHLLKF